MWRRNLRGVVRHRLWNTPDFPGVLRRTTPHYDFEGAVFWRRQNLGKDLRQCLPLQIDIRAGIAHRRVQAGVAEPLTDCGEVDACLEKVDRGRVSNRMRM